MPVIGPLACILRSLPASGTNLIFMCFFNLVSCLPSQCISGTYSLRGLLSRGALSETSWPRQETSHAGTGDYRIRGSIRAKDGIQAAVLILHKTGRQPLERREQAFIQLRREPISRFTALCCLMMVRAI
ncbi:hypothetical protein F5Y06DRAFT_279803 [Hypoxylon sp. FL0890]|nr:hypothetical protein F5Y06DRAFT_279803 [Hypoxylon sp. FL0890]